MIEKKKNARKKREKNIGRTKFEHLLYGTNEVNRKGYL
jgi:hypothetical protein